MKNQYHIQHVGSASIVKKQVEKTQEIKLSSLL